MEQSKLEVLPEEWDRALAVAAHPDDLEYGAASSIARWTDQGKHVEYLLITKGEAGIDSMQPEETARIRMEEEVNSARVVGVNNVEFLDHVDGAIEYGLPLRRDIARAVRKSRPDVIISMNYHMFWPGTTTLNMADHRWAGFATLDAARDAANRWIFPELLEEGLEPWGGVRMVCMSGSPHPTHAVDVTDYMDKGVASLEEHRVYIEGLGQSFDPDMFLRWGASETGYEMGWEYGVSYEVIRI